MPSKRVDGLGPFWAACFWGWAALGIFELLLPLYGRALGASDATIGALFALFSVTALVLRVALGRLLDRVGGKPVFMVGLLLYVVALLIFAWATTVAELVAARLLQGIASTAAWLTAAVLVAGWSGHERAVLFGRFQAISVWGATVGAWWTGTAAMVLDRQIREAVERFVAFPAWLPAARPTLDGLHIIFAGNAGFALLALVCAAWMPVSEQSKASVERWRKVVRPLGSLLVAAALSGAASGLILPIQVLLLDDRFGSGVAGAILAYAAPGFMYALLPIPLGRWADRVGHGRAAALGFGIPALAYALLPIAPSLPIAVGLLCVEAIGLSLATPAANALIADRAPVARGSAYAVYGFAGGGAGALASALGGWLYGHVAHAAPYALAAALMLGAMLVLLRRPHAADTVSIV